MIYCSYPSTSVNLNAFNDAIVITCIMRGIPVSSTINSCRILICHIPNVLVRFPVVIFPPLRHLVVLNFLTRLCPPDSSKCSNMPKSFTVLSFDISVLFQFRLSWFYLRGQGCRFLGIWSSGFIVLFPYLRESSWVQTIALLNLQLIVSVCLH